MDETIIVMRMVERLVSVLIGGVSIYLGYRLFLDIPYQRNQEKGELELPGMKLVLSKVGPGIFFAAFGSLVLYQSMSEEITVTTVPGVNARQQATAQAGANHFVGAANKNPRDDNTRQRLRAITSVETLNCLRSRVEKIAQSDEQQDEFESALYQARMALLLSVWDENWGDPGLVTSYRMNVEPGSQLEKLLNSGECQ